MRDSKDQMRLSGGQSLAVGLTAATPLFSSLREENANESRHSDHIITMVLIRNHRAFSIAKNPCAIRLSTTLEQVVSFIVPELTGRESELEDLNPAIFATFLDHNETFPFGLVS